MPGFCRHRSAARQERRIQALRVCKSMIEATRGGCCTAFPVEAAIWLWEETEELYGGLRPHIPKSCSGNFHDLTNSRVRMGCHTTHVQCQHNQLTSTAM